MKVASTPSAIIQTGWPLGLAVTYPSVTATSRCRPLRMRRRKHSPKATHLSRILVPRLQIRCATSVSRETFVPNRGETPNHACYTPDPLQGLVARRDRSLQEPTALDIGTHDAAYCCAATPHRSTGFPQATQPRQVSADLPCTHTSDAGRRHLLTTTRSHEEHCVSRETLPYADLRTGPVCSHAR